MALLDLQNLEPVEHGNGGGGQPASSLSLIGCISSVSFLICL
ncbi:SapB/AmfS family lanthipeptide [Streptomyces sp. NBC_01190]|nr:SapB/AmfS family lanthipeptide [Streptomyces sp. NBC_01190]